MFLEAFKIFNSIKRNWKHAGKVNCPFGEVEYSALNSSHTPVYWNSLHFLKLKFIENILSSALTLLLKVHNITVHSISFISFFDQLDWQFTHLLTVRW